MRHRGSSSADSVGDALGNRDRKRKSNPTEESMHCAIVWLQPAVVF